MKNRQKVTRVQLNLGGEDNSILIGIVSSDPDYRLSLTINKKLGISLKNSDPLEIGENEGKRAVFSRFADISGAPDIVFSLVSNRSGKMFFLKRFRNIDYLFYIHDSGKSVDSGTIISELREMEEITAVFDIDLKSVREKNVDYLLY